MCSRVSALFVRSFRITYFYIALSKTYYSRFKRKKLLNGYFKDFHDHNEYIYKKKKRNATIQNRIVVKRGNLLEK